MAYRRRYLSGQAATTVTIAEGAITSDKIVDGAVTHPKLAPGSVDSGKVVDESLKSEDIQDGQIKAVDLAPNAVTTDKILDGAVTTQKLEASIQGIARPLTPGVDTAEIQDGKVTLAKLAPDSVDASKIKSGAVGPTELAANAVETDRVKDGAISTAKIAGSAVDATKIAVNAVTGSEILNGSVGVTELATDSVETVKIKDLNVTTDKLNIQSVTAAKMAADAVGEGALATAALSKRHIESKETRVLTHYEEFGGLHVSDKWQRVASGGKTIGINTLDGVHLLTGANNGELHRMSWAGAGLGFVEVVKPTMSAWISSRHASLDYLTNTIGLWKDANNYIIFQAEDLVGALPNWKARCKNLGAEAVVDTGVPITAAIQLLAIEVVDATHVKFYIEGVEETEITTNIPVTQDLWPHLEVITRENDFRWIKVKYVSLLATRPAYA